MPRRTQPSLHTERLVLRPFTSADAPDVQRLAGTREIAATTLNVPHPYPDGAARQWIEAHAPGFASGTLANFAVTLRERGELIGAIGLVIQRDHSRAEMGYWIGVPFWNRGFATEAARALLRFGFGDLGLNRIHASHFTGNPASGRVLEKAGMQYEGVLRQHVEKWGRFEDLAIYGMLASEAGVDPWHVTGGWT